jgi:hypothetical protein
VHEGEVAEQVCVSVLDADPGLAVVRALAVNDQRLLHAVFEGVGYVRSGQPVAPGWLAGS